MYQRNIKLQIHGEKSSYQDQRQYYRYRLVIPKVPRETLSMQDLTGCDYFHTPVIF